MSLVIAALLVVVVVVVTNKLLKLLSRRLLVTERNADAAGWAHHRILLLLMSTNFVVIILAVGGNVREKRCFLEKDDTTDRAVTTILGLWLKPMILLALSIVSDGIIVIVTSTTTRTKLSTILQLPRHRRRKLYRIPRVSAFSTTGYIVATRDAEPTAFMNSCCSHLFIYSIFF